MFIESNRKRYSVVAMCRNLNVTKAGYYAWRRRKPSQRLERDRELACIIIEVHKVVKELFQDKESWLGPLGLFKRKPFDVIK